jgi:hypothetical protein
MGAPLPTALAAASSRRLGQWPNLSSSVLGLQRSQRDVMRAIYARCSGDKERAIREYAEAEQRGEVRRKSNSAKTSSEAYARALLLDGEKKGWLR